MQNQVVQTHGGVSNARPRWYPPLHLGVVPPPAFPQQRHLLLALQYLSYCRRRLFISYRGVPCRCRQAEGNGRYLVWS